MAMRQSERKAKSDWESELRSGQLVVADGDEAKWERGREWLSERAAIWAARGGRWRRGRVRERQRVIERVTKWVENGGRWRRGREAEMRDERVIENWGFQGFYAWNVYAHKPKRRRIGKKTEKSVQWCHLRLETQEPCELTEPVTVHRTWLSDRSSHSSMSFCMKRFFPLNLP